MLLVLVVLQATSRSLDPFASATRTLPYIVLRASEYTAQAIHRAVLYAVSSATKLYVFAALGLLHVVAFGVTPEEVVRPIVETVVVVAEQTPNEVEVAPRPHEAELDNWTQDPLWGLHLLKGPPLHDPHQFDPLDWNKLRHDL